MPPIAKAAIGSAVLEPVLDTVLDNAMRHGGLGVSVQIAVSTAGDFWRISVDDSGPAISAANAARLFEPFFTTARSDGGTGLGLAIARSLLRAQGGSLDYEPDNKMANRFVIQVAISM